MPGFMERAGVKASRRVEFQRETRADLGRGEGLAWGAMGVTNGHGRA